MRLQVEVGEALREHGAELNASASYRGIDEVTPVFCACWSSWNLALVRWLLDHGALLTGGELLAALGHFQRHGKAAYDIADALLASGLPVDGGVRGGRTPLQAFAHQAAHKTVSWLIARGADVNARGPGGRTPAHFAAERNTGATTLAVLVESGADLATCDDDGHTPLDVAELNGKNRLVDWMRKSARAERP
jgi:ankyrin repeat protein